MIAGVIARAVARVIASGPVRPLVARAIGLAIAEA